MTIYSRISRLFRWSILLPEQSGQTWPPLPPLLSPPFASSCIGGWQLFSTHVNPYQISCWRLTTASGMSPCVPEYICMSVNSSAVTLCVCVIVSLSLPLLYMHSMYLKCTLLDSHVGLTSMPISCRGLLWALSCVVVASDFYYKYKL